MEKLCTHVEDKNSSAEAQRYDDDEKPDLLSTQSEYYTNNFNSILCFSLFGLNSKFKIKEHNFLSNKPLKYNSQKQKKPN